MPSMAVQKTFGKRKYPWKKKPLTLAKVSRKVTALVRETEIKNFDVATTSSAPLTLPGTGVIVPVSQVAQGDSSLNRDGRQINMKGVVCNYQHAVAGTPASAGFRCALVLDKNGAGSAPTWVDIFEADNAWSQYNANSWKRFKILYDNFNFIGKYDPVNAVPSAGTIFASDQFKLIKRNIQMVYGPNAANPITNALYLVFHGAGTVQYSHRLSFSDA